jgi:hypothetical protein
MASKVSICKGRYLGGGAEKQAYNAKICDAATATDFTSDLDPAQLCIVEFPRFEWTNPETATEHAESKTQLMNYQRKLTYDPQFKYDMVKLIAEEMEEKKWKKNDVKFDNYTIEPPKKYSAFFDANPKIKLLFFLKNWEDVINYQIDFVNELKIMHELVDLVPRLYQIRIDNDAPFSPNEIDAKFAQIPDKKQIRISYLVEKCDINIEEFLRKNPRKIGDVGQKINECVDTITELFCDFKYKNLCPKYNDANEIVSMRILDVDPKYVITSNAPGFIQNARVFMKFLLFTQVMKSRGLVFPNWFVTREEVDTMIRFFYSFEYMKYEQNPINMLYHYLIRKPLDSNSNSDSDSDSDSDSSPKYHFPGYDKLKTKYTTEESIINLFKPWIRSIPAPIQKEGGKKQDSLGGSKKKRKSKSKKQKGKKRNHTSKRNAK